MMSQMEYDLSFEGYLKLLRLLPYRQWIFEQIASNCIEFQDREHYDRFYWRHKDDNWYVFPSFAVRTEILAEARRRIKPQVSTGLMCAPQVGT